MTRGWSWITLSLTPCLLWLLWCGIEPAIVETLACCGIHVLCIFTWCSSNIFSGWATSLLGQQTLSNVWNYLVFHCLMLFCLAVSTVLGVFHFWLIVCIFLLLLALPDFMKIQSFESSMNDIILTNVQKMSSLVFFAYF